MKMYHQTAFPLTDQQKLLAKALRDFPKKAEDSLKQGWPEGYKLYEALSNLPQKVLNVPGRFLYSDISTLREGKYYLLGHNPDIDLSKNPILKVEIQEWSAKCSNAYLDESWDNYRIGEYKIQRRVQELCKHIVVDKNLDFDARTRQVCASNLFFGRSKSAASLEKSDPNDFWPVHSAMLDIIKPSCVLVVGAGKGDDNTYRIVKSLLGFSNINDIHFPSGHGNLSCFVVKGRHGKRNNLLKLMGVPDFSRFKLNEHALQQITEECFAAGGQ